MDSFPLVIVQEIPRKTTTEKDHQRLFDEGKKKKKRKEHLITETMVLSVGLSFIYQNNDRLIKV